MLEPTDTGFGAGGNVGMSSKVNDLARAMTQILTTLYMHDGDVGIREIAAECGVPKSSLHRMLQALKEEGWVYQGGEDNNYRIGLRLLVLVCWF